MPDGGVVTIRVLSQPESSQPESPERNGELVSSGPGWAELELTGGGASIPVGTAVGVQTSEAVQIGHVESVEIRGNGHRLRFRVDHSLALQDIARIHRFWSQEQPD